MNSKLMAIDLAKNVFQVCVIGVHGQVLSNRRISRHKLSELIANTPPTIIAMEACSSAHFWGRLAHKHGHEARLLPPQHVKAFRGVQKSDGHDALAIGEAAQRPKLHSVPVKDIQQQDLALMVQVRARMKRERTALTNQIRGFAAEYGLSFPKGIAALLSALPHIPVESDMHSAQTSRLLAELGLDLIRLSERLDAVEAQMLEQARVYPAFARLQQIPCRAHYRRDLDWSGRLRGAIRKREANVGLGGPGSPSARHRRSCPPGAHHQSRRSPLTYPIDSWLALGIALDRQATPGLSPVGSRHHRATR